jgi:hypothetical protein
MPFYRVRINEQLPSEECVIEAESEDEALNIRQRDLVEWADMVGLRVDPAPQPAERDKLCR